MARVTMSPEAVTSFRALPAHAKAEFDALICEMDSVARLRLPAGRPTHQLEGSPNLWTLKEGRYRGIFRWDGDEVRFIRFGRVDRIYRNLPK